MERGGKEGQHGCVRVCVCLCRGRQPALSTPCSPSLTAPLPQSIPHHRIQSLHRNLQHISSQLSGVLGMLVSLDPSLPHLTSTPLQPHAPMAACPTLLSTSSSTALTSTQWAWALRSPLSSVTQAVDDFLVEKWHKYFPSESLVAAPSASFSPPPPATRI